MRVYRFDTIDSTNKFLKEKKDLQNKDLVIAKVQTNGRGRRDNKWESPLGAALFSFILEYDNSIQEEEYMKLSLVVGHSLLKSMETVEKQDYKFKWTNDIYLDNRKLSGILIERVANFFIIGIGININNTNFNEVGNIAISLKEKTKKTYEVDDIIFKIVENFFEDFKRFKNNNWKQILEEINSKNYLFGKRVDILGLFKEETGLAGDILEDGRLEVFVGDRIKRYSIGEIKERRENEI